LGAGRYFLLPGEEVSIHTYPVCLDQHPLSSNRLHLQQMLSQKSYPSSRLRNWGEPLPDCRPCTPEQEKPSAEA
ncbi:MAG: hypothetical protein OXF25_00265, partial [Cyanobacteria bacterium MAG CAR3_bin_5]|nr:hypothetical protein [Cyanobacteria bacterium MAG CAR3_bin_5]